MPDQSSASKPYSIRLQPVGRRAEAGPDMSILEAAQMAGVELVSLCGGIGACDSCKVRLMSGKLTPLTLEEEAVFTPAQLAGGFRLACQARPLSDVVIDIPPESLTTPQRLQVEGQSIDFKLDPVVKPYDLVLDPPALDDLRADTTRVRDALVAARAIPQGASQLNGSGLSYDYSVLGELSTILRKQNWSARLALRAGEVVAALPVSQPLVGLAVDVGSTKLAAFLVDLGSGQTLAKTGAMNPQIAFGEDVVSRIAYANTHPGGGKLLQSRLVETLNTMLETMQAEAAGQGVKIQPEQIVEAVIVGNTAMHHLFAGLPVVQLGAAPYVPSVGEPIDIPAERLGLALAHGAYVHLPPNIAGYVGADHVAMLLATGMTEANQRGEQRTAVALDIGTNTEISLAYQGKLYSCSCASGPAFEGAHIHDGMRAAPGAIERVQVTESEVRIHTIGDQPPVGICGSGILDAVAQMLSAGVLDHRGALQAGHPAVRMFNGQGNNGRSAFLLAEAAKAGHGQDVIVTRKDVNEIQLAKGAIRAGVEILMLEAGIPSHEAGYEVIDDFIVAGAFGTYINVESAMRVGMFPPLPLERFHQVGNAAGAGARQMLVSLERRRLAEQIVGRVQYVELSGHPHFTGEFSKAIFFTK